MFLELLPLKEVIIFKIILCRFSMPAVRSNPHVCKDPAGCFWNAVISAIISAVICAAISYGFKK